MGGPQCRLSILKNDNVPCRYFLNVPVDLKIAQCHLSILRNGKIPCHYFGRFPVDFKIVQCRLSNLRKGCVALSNLRVKAHRFVPLPIGYSQPIKVSWSRKSAITHPDRSVRSSTRDDFIVTPILPLYTGRGIVHVT